MSAAHSPNRPERSSARLSATGHSTDHSTEGHGAFGGVTAAASNGVVNAYNRAPDLGITSTANSAYQRAPDLGVGATINRYLGQGEAGTDANSSSTSDYRKEPRAAPAADDNDEYEHDRVIRPDERRKKQSEGEAETRRQESERLGPSDQSRVGKLQKEIGTETGIPTAAGAGSTASADQTNVKALEKAESKGSVHQANVPEDYEAVYCPTENAGTGKSDHVTDSNHYSSRKEQEGDQREKKGRDSNVTSNRNSGSHDHTSSSSPSEKRNSHKSQTFKTSDGNELEMEKRRSLGSKFKDQIKGEIKILAGTVTGNDEKIIKGMHIKEGDHE